MHILDVLTTAISALITSVIALAVTLGILPVETPPPFEAHLEVVAERPVETPEQKFAENDPEETSKPVEEAPQAEPELSLPEIEPPAAPTQPETTESDTSAKESVPLSPSFTEINTATRAALVNIVCSTSAGSPLNGVSGSGVIISSDGVVITNAHVAQYYLLLGQPSLGTIDCIMRTGAPAKNTYRAELVYLPTAWVSANAVKITQSAPTGTGEYDFAILRVTERVDGQPLGTTPFVTIDARELKEDEPVLLAGYAAGFLGSNLISKDLSITSAITTVQKLFTFGSGDIDLVDVSGTIVSQKGSSGGAVIDANNHLRALVVTSSQDENTSDRELHAVTLAHVDRALRAGTNQTLAQFIANTFSNGQSYRANTMPSLSAVLTAAVTN